jgi:hypothetical protein
MESKSLREIAISVGARVEGEQIIFASEDDLEMCVGKATVETLDAIGDFRRKQWDDATRLYERWKATFGSHDVAPGLEDHYAEGVALFLLGVNKRQRASKLSKAERDRVEEQVNSLR